MRIAAKVKHTYRQEYPLVCDFKDHLEQFGHSDFTLLYSKRIAPKLGSNQTWYTTFDQIMVKSYTPAYIKLTGCGNTLYITGIERIIELVYDNCTEYVIICNDADIGDTPIHSVVRLRMQQVNPSF